MENLPRDVPEENICEEINGKTVGTTDETDIQETTSAEEELNFWPVRKSVFGPDDY